MVRRDMPSLTIPMGANNCFKLMLTFQVLCMIPLFLYVFLPSQIPYMNRGVPALRANNTWVFDWKSSISQRKGRSLSLLPKYTEFTFFYKETFLLVLASFFRVLDYFAEYCIIEKSVTGGGWRPIRAALPRYPIQFWIHYSITALNDEHRTNDVSEGWHNRFHLLMDKNHLELYPSEISIVELNFHRYRGTLNLN